MKIVIDARTLRTSTGRYIERLIHYLQKIDNKNDYVILLKPKDFDSWQPSNPRFKKVICPYKEYTFAEQIGFKKQLESLHPDLVHFAMVQQPVWYNSSPVVTTMQDLTTVRFRNPDKNPVVFWIKQQIYKWVNKKVAKKSSLFLGGVAFGTLGLKILASKEAKKGYSKALAKAYKLKDELDASVSVVKQHGDDVLQDAKYLYKQEKKEEQLDSLIGE